MQPVELAPIRPGIALPTVDDEAMASRSSARLLITAATPDAVDTLARRIHATGRRARSPFVSMQARDFPVEPQLLSDTCSHLLDVAAGGSVFISGVEELPPPVQDVFIDLFARLQCARAPTGAIRFIAGTTVSLLDCVAAGAFSDRLFYRLNAIHIVITHPRL